MHKVAFILYACFVSVISLSPAGQDSVGDLDKIAHLLVYYIFAVFGYRALTSKRLYLYLCMGIIAYSGLLELGQSYIPGREMSAYDWLANGLGVLLGALVATRKRPQAPAS